VPEAGERLNAPLRIATYDVSLNNFAPDDGLRQYVNGQAGQSSRIRLIKKALPHHCHFEARFAEHGRNQSEAKKQMAKKAKKAVRREYTTGDVRELRAHSKARTPVAKIAKQMKRSVGSLRQKALALGIRLGHVQRKRATRSSGRIGKKKR